MPRSRLRVSCYGPSLPRVSPHRRRCYRPPVPVIPIAEFEDPNLDKDTLLLEDDSPYPEVRSAVANTDDPDMPVNTFRAWFIGIIWAIIIPGLDQFFFFRYPSVTITGVGTLRPIFLPSV